LRGTPAAARPTRFIWLFQSHILSFLPVLVVLFDLFPALT